MVGGGVPGVDWALAGLASMPENTRVRAMPPAVMVRVLVRLFIGRLRVGGQVAAMVCS